jgi:hypothetical protein
METGKNDIARPASHANTFTKIGGFWKRIGMWLGIVKPPGEGPSEPEKDRKPPLEQLNETLDQEFGHFQGHVALHGIEKDLMLSAKFMMNAGFADGVNGIAQKPRSNDIVVLAASRAQRLYNFAQSVLNGKKAKATTDLFANEKLVKRSEEQDVDEHRNLEVIRYYRMFHPKSFNFLWSLFCIVFGVILMAADYPLANSLLSVGFDFIGKWEGKLTAIGIALCTVYIKIYYDSYIEIRYGNALLVESRFEAMYDSISAGVAGSKASDFRVFNGKEQAKKKRWHTFILCFTVAGIFIMGWFRAEAAHVAASETPGTIVMPMLVYTVGFIFLTLVFPVISGICFSVGLGGMQNLSRYRRTTRNCKTTRAEYIAALKEYTAVQQEFGDIDAELKKWQADRTVATYTSVLLSYYDKGYRLGAANPDDDNIKNDLFTLAEHWRKKALSRKINNNIIKLSGL